MKYISSASFKKTHTGAIAKQSTVEAPRVDEENRRVTFVVSSEEPDRDGDVIVQAGIRLSNYKTNPVLLWGHDSSDFPIGKCVEIGIKSGKMTAIFELAPAIDNCKSETVFQLLKGGYLFATSIGFVPRDWERMEEGEGYLFNDVELLEISVVSIPANPEAVLVPPVQEPEKSATDINTKTNEAMMLRKRQFEVIKRRA